MNTNCAMFKMLRKRGIIAYLTTVSSGYIKMEDYFVQLTILSSGYTNNNYGCLKFLKKL